MKCSIITWSHRLIKNLNQKKKIEPEPVTISEQSEGWRTSPSMYDAAMIQSAMTMSLLINNNYKKIIIVPMNRECEEIQNCELQ